MPLYERWAARPRAAGQILSMCCKQHSDLVSGQPVGQPVGTQGGCCSRVISSWSLELEPTRRESCKFLGPSEDLSTAYWLQLAGAQADSMPTSAPVSQRCSDPCLHPMVSTG